MSKIDNTITEDTNTFTFSQLRQFAVGSIVRAKIKTGPFRPTHDNVTIKRTLKTKVEMESPKKGLIVVKKKDQVEDSPVPNTFIASEPLDGAEIAFAQA